MKAYIITLTENEGSTTATDIAIQSSVAVGNNFGIEIFDAVTPERVEQEMELFGLEWNWPWEHPQIDLQSGLTKMPYLTAYPKKRMACFMSHYRLWKHCAEHNEPLLILEHDVFFTRKVPLELLDDCGFHVIGLNDPRKATRKSQMYHEGVQLQDGPVVVCPKIDMDQVAQGLAGNSAYYLKPEGAKKLVDLVAEYGAWPNDAIMCRQLMPRKIGQLRKYCSTVQNLVSSTKT